MLLNHRFVFKMFFILSILLIAGCEEDKKEYANANVNVNELRADFNKWARYHYTYIDLTSNFTALDEDANEITRKEFVQKLTSGKFIPVKMNSTKNSLYYKLFTLDEKSPEQLSKSIRSMASRDYVNVLHLDNKYPEFSFQDINGKTYKSEDLSGKHLVIKYWFINCKPCVAEMPEFEFVMNKHQNQDVVFMSIAFDDPEELQEFFKDKDYEVPTISVSEDYIIDTIGIKYFPTHFLLDEQRKIVSVTNNMKQLRKRLKDFVN
ncbi:TlpA family protein disulfide reductase [Gramella sp. BOM4]|nr:TlpA family protein disulfide reductase [Christiangramia bathymodioli]